MIVEGWAFCGVTPETVVAMNRVGGKVLGTIQGEQQLIGKDPKAAERAALLKPLKDLKIHPIEVTRHQGIEQVAYLVVTGNRLNAKQRPGIMGALVLLQMALGIEH